MNLSHILALIGLLMPMLAFAGSSSLRPGTYGTELRIGLAPLDEGRMTGYFATADGSCRIYLHGLPRGEIYQLALATPGNSSFIAYGELLLTYDGETPIVQLDVPVPPTCMKSAPDLAKRQFRLTSGAAWTGVRLVQSARAYFHDEAHDSTRRKAYVVKWDAIAFDRETPAFVRGEFLGGKAPVTGWLRQEDVFSADFTPEMEYVRSKLPPMQGKWSQGSLPIDVRAYLNARERCEHFQGEEGTDAARQKFLATAVARECGDTKARYQALVARYAGKTAETRFLKLNQPPQ